MVTWGRLSVEERDELGPHIMNIMCGPDPSHDEYLSCAMCDSIFGRPLQVMVRPMLRDCCPVCLSVCDVGVLWPNGWMDQDATWHGGRPLPRRHCVRWEHSSPGKGAHQSSLFGPCLLWPNGRPSQQLLSSCTFTYETV